MKPKGRPVLVSKIGPVEKSITLDCRIKWQLGSLRPRCLLLSVFRAVPEAKGSTWDHSCLLNLSVQLRTENQFYVGTVSGPILRRPVQVSPCPLSVVNQVVAYSYTERLARTTRLGSVRGECHPVASWGHCWHAVRSRRWLLLCPSNPGTEVRQTRFYQWYLSFHIPGFFFWSNHSSLSRVAVFQIASKI